jgi:hypothetical protein
MKALSTMAVLVLVVVFATVAAGVRPASRGSARREWIMRLRLACMLVLGTGSCLFQSAWSADSAPREASARGDHYNPAYGRQYGYMQEGSSCTAVRVPAHAYLNSMGDEWDCQRGSNPHYS